MCPSSMSCSSVGTAKSGVPMKTSFMSSHGLPRRLCRLGELLDHAIALEARDAIDEQHAVQMIDLVLDAGGHQPLAVALPELALAVEVTDAYRLGPRHHLEHLGDAEASLLIFGGFPRGGDDLGIDEIMRLAGLVLLLHEIHHHDALRHPDLDRGKPDAGRGIHGVEHVVHEGANLVGDLVDG